MRLGADTNASGSRYERIWEQIRMRLGADTSASGSRYGRIWEQVRTHMGRCSPKGIGFDVGSNIFSSIGPIRYIMKVGKKAINETEQKGECPFAP